MSEYQTPSRPNRDGGPLTCLFEVSEAVCSSVDRDELLGMILRTALAQTGATRGSILLKDNGGRTLSVAASVGLDETIVRTVRVRVGEGIAGQVAESGQPLLVVDIDRHPDLAPFARNYPDKSFVSVPLTSEGSAKEEASTKAESILAVPVRASRKVMGVLNVHRKASGGPFTQRDLQFLSILANQAAVAIDNARLVDDLENTYMNAFGSMALLLEAKDPYTQGHTERVTGLCEDLGRALGMGEHDLHNLVMGARLHDIGKIGIHETILNKPGRLDEEEWLLVREHPVVADRVLASINFLQGARPIVRGHHERLDGKGYPDGLDGDQLTLGQKIIIVVDAYDAMSSSRSYRRALGPEQIHQEFAAHLGTQFDPDVVEALFNFLDFHNAVPA